MNFCASTATILANSPQYYAIRVRNFPILSNYLNSLLSLQSLLLLLGESYFFELMHFVKCESLLQ